MQIVLENNIKKLIPTDEDKWLLDKADLEKALEERYYFKFAYLPPQTTLEECEGKYIETNKEEINV